MHATQLLEVSTMDANDSALHLVRDSPVGHHIDHPVQKVEVSTTVNSQGAHPLHRLNGARTEVSTLSYCRCVADFRHRFTHYNSCMLVGPHTKLYHIHTHTHTLPLHYNHH